MQYSITQEAAADHAAMTFLDASGQSARGLLQFFQILQGEEMLSGIREDPYLRTHPLTAQRIDYLRNHVEHSRFSDVPDTQTNIDLLKRTKVKLDAFISPPSSTLAAYPEKDQSVLARYARAIAYYRNPGLAPAGDRLRARQSDRHGGPGASRGRAGRGKEEGCPAAGPPRQGLITEELSRL